MSLTSNISNLVVREATEFKKVYGQIGSLTSLSTTDKTSLQAAINELYAYSHNLINDANASASSVYSANKVIALIASAKSEILGGADSLHDTLKEIQDLIVADEAGFAAFTTALGNRLRFDAAQSLTAPQKAQGIANLGAISATDIGDVNTDFVAVFNAALV